MYEVYYDVTDKNMITPNDGVIDHMVIQDSDVADAIPPLELGDDILTGDLDRGELLAYSSYKHFCLDDSEDEPSV